MFDDMTPPMVRPEARDGYIVQPKVSERPTNMPDDATIARQPVVLPRVSVDPDSVPSTTTTTTTMPAPQPTVAPVAPKAPMIAPVVPKAPAMPSVPMTPGMPAPVVTQPAKPKMMKPIVDEVYIKREKPVAKKAPAIKTNDEERTIAVPAPPKKPVAPVKNGKESETQPIADKDPVSDLSKTAPVMIPAIRDPKESAIKGPVEMPAIPAQSVDTKVLFDDKKAAAPEPTILERQQEAVKNEKALVPIVPRPKDGVAPATFEAGDKQNVLKKSIPFNPGQIALGDADIDPIAAGVVKEMDKEDNKDWRVRISAFATPYGNGLSSDRRIALSRALSLRTSLITQGVAASKIDVLAEGLQSDGKPGDRIDLYLYGPEGK